MKLWKRLVSLWHGVEVVEKKPLRTLSPDFAEGIQRFARNQIAQAEAAEARAKAAKAKSPDGKNPFTFDIDWEEHEKVNAFLKEHAHPGKYMGAIGGQVSYTFCPTSIGTVVSVKCSACGERCCPKGYRQGVSIDASGNL